MSKIDYQNVDLALLGRVTNLINSTLDVPTLLGVIMDSAKELIGAESSSLLFLDEDARVLNFFVVAGDNGELIKEITVPVGEGIAGIVAETEESLIVNDAINDPRIYKKVDQEINQVTRNLICVPMRVKDKLVGVIEAINSTDEKDFDEGQMKILEYIADQAAIAINNSDLFRDLAKARISLQKKIKELSILFRFNDIVNFSITEKDLLDRSIHFISTSLDIEYSLLYLYSQSEKEFTLVTKQGIDTIPSIIKSFKLDQTIESFFAKHPKTVQIKSQIPESFKILTFIEINFPILVVPLFSEEKIFGLIFLWGAKDKKFQTEDIPLMDNLASHLAQSYSNLKMTQKINTQTEIKQELKVAHLIQQKILPATFNTPAGIDIQGISIPAEEVGGDFYDFIPIDQNKFAIVIGDVSGKGIPAALFMALTRNTIRTEVFQDPNPKNVISITNVLLNNDSESGMFVTGAYFLIDTFNKAITYVSAGHNNQIFYRSKSNEIEIIKGDGRPLGILEDTLYEEKVIFYEPGDLLVLFSDGIVEAEKYNGEQFQEERTIEFVENHHSLGVAEMVSEFKKHVMTFTEGKPFTDDFTLLITRLQ